ncbi:uncharacterized protein LOC113230328 [Hyposmocoma kahamanoa]|uniref:uncharacterized protein LOC113230328 n=1 Tax=Hyposmocoma kahamanoa TaxID=1477025 RepID=UPI000E6D6667|nr:uncharacterized protein LOC113230328 [Hyposmocoma kahamanoa]
MSVFDLLDLASPVTINAKKLLQEVWRRGIGWEDDPSTWPEEMARTSACRLRRATTHYKRTLKNKQNDPEGSKLRRHDVPKPRPRTLEEKKTLYKTLDATFLKKAERLIMCASQHEAFYEKLRDLRIIKPPSTRSRLRPLAVELVNGMIILKTRIKAAADITDSQKRPAVLNGNHPAVKLYIGYVHRQLNHSEVEATVNECKQHYCILRLRPIAKMTIYRCIQCRIKSATPTVPPTGDQPRCRLAHHQRPFTYTCLDYFGPLAVTVGRTTQKRYVMRFTCLTTRAVHLEVVTSLNGDSAVVALRRMIACRGCPTEIWSDNSTNFHAADKELRQAFADAAQNEAEKHLIKWRFIPPGAPVMGGAWERLVRSVKTDLDYETTLHYESNETLITLLAEAEYTVNSRPLTHVSVDPCEAEAITSNHFLLAGLARVPLPDSFVDATLVGQIWRTSQRLADHFWNRWLREYLPTLQDRREPHGPETPIEVEDVVLIADGTLLTCPFSNLKRTSSSSYNSTYI